MKEHKDKSGISLGRRRLLANAGLVAAGTAVGLPRLAAASDVRKEIVWDREVDVICVGSGAAACTAAVTATARGASVLVLEKMPMPGGTTGKSGGVTWIPNHKHLAGLGVQDPKDDCLKYMARYAYPEVYDAASPTLGLTDDAYSLIEAFYDNGSRMLDFMEQADAIKFKPFKLWTVDDFPPDYGEHLPENKANNVRALEPDQGAGPASGGGSLAYQLETWLQERDVPMLLEHRVEEIIMEDDRVVGLKVDHAGKTLMVKANKGVIFGTGGYAHNTELLELHQKPGVYGSCAAPGATGDLLIMAQRAGARMGRLDTAWRTQVVFEETLANRALGGGVFFAPGDSMIQVNRYGKRCVNEKRNYNDRTRAHFTYDPVKAEYPNQFLFMIFDERTLNRYRGAYPIPHDRREASWIIEGEGVEGLTVELNKKLKSLAGKVGSYRLDEKFSSNLAETIERFNRFAGEGVDGDFDRGTNDYDKVWQKVFSPVNSETDYPANDMPNPTMHAINSKKLYAIILAPGALDTSGGPAINKHSQIMAAGGEPIKGLYGAGNCVASPVGPAYLGAGGTIGLAMTFGWIAANHLVES